MARSRTALQLGTCILLGLTLSACALRVHDTRGNFLEMEKIELIKPGMTQADVAKVLGTPATSTLFRDDSWLYIGTKESHIAFASPRIDATRIFRIQFDGQGHVLTTALYEPTRLHDIPISRHKTQDLSHSRSPLQRIFGNVGRFNKKNEPVKPRVGGASGV